MNVCSMQDAFLGACRDSAQPGRLSSPFTLLERWHELTAQAPLTKILVKVKLRIATLEWQRP